MFEFFVDLVSGECNTELRFDSSFEPMINWPYAQIDNSRQLENEVLVNDTTL